MVHYLQTLADGSLLEFPLKIVRSEFPDFFLNFTDYSIAFEIRALHPILYASIETWQSRYELPRRIRQISVLRDSELLYECGSAA